MPKFRVPNFINFDPSIFTNEDRYHLFEGYGISVPHAIRSQPSGKHYQYVWFEDKFVFDQILSYTGYHHWWERYEPDRSFLGNLLGRWKKKETP